MSPSYAILPIGYPHGKGLAQLRIGIDVGGTFTDLVAMGGGESEPVVFKTPTTPADPSDGVLAGLDGLWIRTPARCCGTRTW